MILRTHLILVAGLACAAPALAEDQAAMELAKKDGCLACDALDKKVVGPSWIEVGKKYAGDAGAVPMPPNVTVKDDDIKKLVQYVLSLK